MEFSELVAKRYSVRAYAEQVLNSKLVLRKEIEDVISGIKITSDLDTHGPS